MKKILFLAIALLVFAPAAQAGNFYVGASFLEAGLEVDFDAAVDDFDEDDSGFKFFGGYQLGKFLDIEAGYYDMGAPSQDLGILGEIELETTAWNLAAKGKLPLGERIELFAKAGLFLWDGESNGALVEDDDGTDFGYGAGISVLLGKLELRGELELVEFDEVDLEILSLGAAWRF
jgi:OOP family OmpA-OmpF porin